MFYQSRDNGLYISFYALIEYLSFAPTMQLAIFSFFLELGFDDAVP